MKKKDVKIGQEYVVRVSGDFVAVKIISESPYGGWDGINMKTNRKIRIKSAQRLRMPIQHRAGGIWYE